MFACPHPWRERIVWPPSIPDEGPPSLPAWEMPPPMYSVSSHVRDEPGPGPGPPQAERQKVPTSLAHGHQVSASCTRARCPAQHNQVVPRISPHADPRGGENLNGTGEGWRGICPGDLLPEVLQKLRLTSGRAGLGFFSARQLVLLLRWGRWSCSADWGKMGRKTKFSKAGVACAQFKPNASPWHHLRHC